MKSINDYQGFTEVSETLGKLTASVSTMRQQHAAMIAQLAQGVPPTGASKDESDIARAKGLLAGEFKANPLSAFEQLRIDELELRQRLAAGEELLIKLIDEAEHQRVKASFELRRQLDAEFEGVRSQFDAAARAMVDACQAEKALIGRFISGGFGVRDAEVSRADWLDRQALLAS